MPSMYGIYTYIYHKNQPNVGKYTIHGSYGVYFNIILHSHPPPVRSVEGNLKQLMAGRHIKKPSKMLDEFRSPDAQCMTYLPTFG